SSIVVRMMAFDKNKDGKLTKDEVTDERLHRLFDRADTNKDGVVTKEELIALAAQMEAEIGQGGGRGGAGGRRRRTGGGGGGGGWRAGRAWWWGGPGGWGWPRRLRRPTHAGPDPAALPSGAAELDGRAEETTGRAAERGGRQAWEDPHGRAEKAAQSDARG